MARRIQYASGSTSKTRASTMSAMLDRIPMSEFCVPNSMRACGDPAGLRAGTRALKSGWVGWGGGAEGSDRGCVWGRGCQNTGGDEG